MGKGIRCNEHCPHLTPDGLISRIATSIIPNESQYLLVSFCDTRNKRDISNRRQRCRGVKLNQLVNLRIGQIQFHDVDNK